jgi:hypothetical protein
MENNQPVTPTPQEVQDIPPQMPPQGFFLQGINKKLLIITGVVLGLILILLISLFVVSKNNKQSVVPQTAKTWEIIFSYDTTKDNFTFNKLTLLNRKITPDYRGAKYSSFELEVLDSKGKALYSQKVPVVTELPDYGGFSIEPPSTSSGTLPKIYPNQNILYAPHFAEEKRVILKRDGKTVLDLALPAVKKTTSAFFSTKQAYAAESCRPIVVAFVSDNYTNFTQYHKDVQVFEQAFLTTEPYSSLPGMFEFRIIDNSQSLGCGTQGLGYCITQRNAQIHQIAFGKYSDVSKIVVIANAPEQNPNEPGLLGISQGIGQDLAIFPNNFGNVSALTLTTARHEFLGHTVGMLYDRYIMNASVQGQESYGLIQNGLRSNCTDNLSGESWWKTAGSTVVVRGCGNQFATYGGTALTCVSHNSKLISGGDHTSIMSAGGCGGTQFDSIEKYWITNNVLPDYTGCTNGSGVTPPVGTISTPTPSTTPVPQESNQIIVTVFTDTNNNLKQDNGESGIQGASITLSGALNQSVNTDANGGVTFQNVPAGNYTLVAKVSGQIVGQGPFSIPNDVITTAKITIPVSPQFLANPTPITIAPIVVTPTTLPTATPVPTGGFEPNGTPVPTPDTLYNCHLDPNCVKSGKSIQQCQLICTPQ